MLRMLPAHQRFHADNLAGVQANLRLIEHPQLVVLQRAMQRAFKVQSRHGLVGHAFLEKAVAVAAALLRFIHRHIRILDQRHRCEPGLGRHGNADARRHHDLAALQ